MVIYFLDDPPQILDLAFVYPFHYAFEQIILLFDQFVYLCLESVIGLFGQTDFFFLRKWHDKMLNKY